MLDFIIRIDIKDMLYAMLNKYKIVRILYNSETCYGFMIENNKIILPIEKNNELIEKFKQKYME